MQATGVVTTEGMTPWHGFNDCGLKFGCAVMAAIFCICHVLSEHGNTTTVLLRAIHPAFSRNIYMTLGDWLPAGLIHSLSLTLNHTLTNWCWVQYRGRSVELQPKRTLANSRTSHDRERAAVHNPPPPAYLHCTHSPAPLLNNICACPARLATHRQGKGREDGPCSSYSRLLTHSWWKEPRLARMLPPSHEA